MRTLSFMLAFAFVLAGASVAGSSVAGSSVAGSSDAGLPGVGTFAYSGSPISASASHSIVMAVR